MDYLETFHEDPEKKDKIPLSDKVFQVFLKTIMLFPQELNGYAKYTLMPEYLNQTTENIVNFQKTELTDTQIQTLLAGMRGAHIRRGIRPPSESFDAKRKFEILWREVAVTQVECLLRWIFALDPEQRKKFNCDGLTSLVIFGDDENMGEIPKDILSSLQEYITTPEGQDVLHTCTTYAGQIKNLFMNQELQAIAKQYRDQFGATPKGEGTSPMHDPIIELFYTKFREQIITLDLPESFQRTMV